MSNWPGKFVIGLTGNIATGKSVVRRMLEHLGAYSIDADALAHRAISKGAPGYQSVVDTFGRWIVEKDEEIDRAKLGDLVFKRSSHPIVVIEAIKLLEGSLHEACDTIWVTDAPEDVRIERLMRKRNLSRKEALQRIHAQNPQQDKNLAADVVINIQRFSPLVSRSHQKQRFLRRPVEAGNDGLETNLPNRRYRSSDDQGS